MKENDEIDNIRKERKEKTISYSADNNSTELSLI